MATATSPPPTTPTTTPMIMFLVLELLPGFGLSGVGLSGFGLSGFGGFGLSGLGLSGVMTGGITSPLTFTTLTVDVAPMKLGRPGRFEAVAVETRVDKALSSAIVSVESGTTVPAF